MSATPSGRRRGTRTTRSGTAGGRGSCSRATSTPSRAGQRPGIEDGAVVGLGASDMKGGVAVMIELAQELGDDNGFLFFPARSCCLREPLPHL